MSYFNYSGKIEKGDEIILSGDEAHHIIKSRRIEIGENIEIQDSLGSRFVCKVIKVRKSEIVAEALSEAEIPENLRADISLFQAITKTKHLDLIVEKATELGANRIVLFPSQHSPLSAKNLRQERFDNISKESAKQCGRKNAPEIEILKSFKEALAEMSRQEILFLSDLTGKDKFDSQKISNKAGLCVGPEGGFKQIEKESLKKLPNILSVKLCNNILKAETASIAGLAQLICSL